MDRKTMQSDRRNRIASKRQLIAMAALIAAAAPVRGDTHSNPYVLSPETRTETRAPTNAEPIQAVAPTAGLRRLRRLPPVAALTANGPRAQSGVESGAVDLGAPTTAQTVAEASNRETSNLGTVRQSVTASSFNRRAEKLLDDAFREYTVAAWASAEASAWEALESLATAMDVSRPSYSDQRQPKMTARLRSARDAIREARDFLSGGELDRDLFRAMVESHQTCVFTEAEVANASAVEAVDRYLDRARLELTPLAGYQIQAARAMDLLAAIMLGRNDAKRLPTETALCLRRAALDGQPQNASLASRLGMQLASMGLDNEAESTLRQAMAISPSQEVAQALGVVSQRTGSSHSGYNASDFEAGKTEDARPQRHTASMGSPAEPTRRVPEVIHLSRKQFASISRPVNLSAGNASVVPPPAAPASYSQVVGYEPNQPQAATTTDRDSKKSGAGGFFSRLPKLPKLPASLW